MHVPVKCGNEKQVKWSLQRWVLSVDNDGGIVTAAGSGGHRISATLEDVCAALVDDELAVMNTETMDQLQEALKDSFAAVRDANVELGDLKLTWDDNQTKNPVVGDRIEVF